MTIKTRKHAPREQDQEVASVPRKEIETAYVVHTLAQVLATQLAARPVPPWPTWIR